MFSLCGFFTKRNDVTRHHFGILTQYGSAFSAPGHRFGFRVPGHSWRDADHFEWQAAGFRRAYLCLVSVILAVSLFDPAFCRVNCVQATKGYSGPGLSPARKARTLAITVTTGAIFGLSTYVYVLAFEKAGAVSAAIALQAYPLFAMVLEAIFLGRRKSRGELFFTFLIIAALYYLATGGTWRIDGFSFWSVFALGVPLLWSVAHVALKEVLDTTPITPNQVTFSRLLVSTAFLLLANIAFDSPAGVFKRLADRRFPGLRHSHGIRLLPGTHRLVSCGPAH